MERAFPLVRVVRLSSIMSKYGRYSYRKKSGSRSKSRWRFGDEYGWSETPAYSGTHASSSRQANFSHSGRAVADPRPDFQNRQYRSTRGVGPRMDRTYKSSAKCETKVCDRPDVREERDFKSIGSTDSNSRPKLKPPPGLKGKELGLWYRDRNKKLKQDKVVELHISSETEKMINDTLLETSEHIYNSEGLFQCEDLDEKLATFEEKINESEIPINRNDPELDTKLYDELLHKQKSSHYMKIRKTRESLPTFAVKDAILNLIKQNQVLVVSGGTGCGKTTQIVQYVLDDCIMNMKGSMCNIICTQPRRISAVSVAERVSFERDEQLGDSIGYQIRLENEISARKKGCINFLTTGTLLAWLETDPLLVKVSHLFLDEIHERTIECDLMMALLKYIIPRRQDLKIILMSATVNENSFSKYFDDAEKISIPGLTYPVEEIFLEEILQKTKFTFQRTKKPSPDPVFNDYIIPYTNDIESRGYYSKFVIQQLRNPLSEALNVFLMGEVVKYICANEKDGAILVFVPGLSDIYNLQKLLTNSEWFHPSKYFIIPMHSIIPTKNQKEAFIPAPCGKRKIIIATSILETSITINDVVYVVDCGKNKQNVFDIKGKVDTLEPTWISYASAKQRQGRAGRTKPGKCYKLYTKIRQDLFDPFPLPESQCVSLEVVILKAKLLRLGKVAPFLSKLIDPPEPEMVELSLEMLRNLRALDNEERLTALGRHLAKLPLDPQTGRMVLMAALFGCVDPIFSIAACLSFKDPFLVPLGLEDEVCRVKEHLSGGEKSDHFLYSEILRKWEDLTSYYEKSHFAHSNFLSDHTVNLLSDMKRQFGCLLHSMKFLPTTGVKDMVNNVNSRNAKLVKAIVCAGLYPNVAVLKKTIKAKQPITLLKTMNHNTVLFHIKSCLNKQPVFESPFFVYHRIIKSTAVFIHDATMVHPMALLFFGGRLDIIQENGVYYMHVDDMIRVKTTQTTAALIKSMRDRLDWVVQSALCDPEGFNVEKMGVKTKIMDVIVKLLSADEMVHVKDDSSARERYLSHI